MLEPAPTPPPSPPELLIDETRCQPELCDVADVAAVQVPVAVKEDRAPKTPEINMKSPRTPDLEIDVSRGPMTPELVSLAPSFANPNAIHTTSTSISVSTTLSKAPSVKHLSEERKPEVKDVKEEVKDVSFMQQSPAKRGRKPTGT